jgi:RNA polymerase sigma factor (sigma-70 family)
MSDDTQMGGGAGRFPLTRHSVVVAMQGSDPAERQRGYETLVATYWKPVYKYLRIKWQASSEDAKDLTQEFFTRAVEKSFFDRYDPARARFRTFLRTCLDGFAANERKSASRLKRGGGQSFVPLDFETAEGELRQHEPASTVDLDEYFHQEWIRSLFGNVVATLRTECRRTGKDGQFAVFERYDLDPATPKPTYQEIASQLGLSTTDVTNYLSWTRREFRRLVLDELRAITATDEEFRAEARELLGVDPE